MNRDISSQLSSSVSRRTALKSGVAGAAAIAFGALAGNTAAAQGPGTPPGNGLTNRKGQGHRGGYGELVPTVDQATGLTLLALPEGFGYFSYGWTGQTMSDGQPTPTDHDGMAVVSKRGREITLVRNHELSAGESTRMIVDGGAGNYNPAEHGGTSSLVFDPVKGEFTGSWASLGGTIRNCAGGLTPWESWISCEETFHDWRGDNEFNHGYIFDVPGWGTSNATPIRAAGRFSHEAVAVDPKTGIVYETEDTGASALYAYMNPGGKKGIADGGELYAMVVDGASRFDLRHGFTNGQQFSVSWEQVGDPEGRSGRPFDSAPNAAIISRGEGAWYDSGLIYFVSTDGGAAREGQIWALDPKRDLLTLVYESPDPQIMDAPDNIAVSPRGGIILCEDGGSNPKRMIGLSQAGETFEFAQNIMNLADGDVARIDDVYPGVADNFYDSPVGSYSGSEWAGATFYKDWLFANVQSPGVTYAITGPWRTGAL